VSGGGGQSGDKLIIAVVLVLLLIGCCICGCGDLVLVDDAGRGEWDLKPRSRIALPTGIDGGDLSGIADVGRIALNLDELVTLARKMPMPERSN